MQPGRFPALRAVDELHVELIAAVNVREADRAASAVDHAADHAGAAELSPEASQGQEPAHSPAFLPLQLAPIGEASDEDVQSVGTTASMAHVATATVAQLTLSYLAPPSDEGGSSRAQQQELPVSGATPDDMPDGDQLMDRPPESKGASMSAARHHVLAAAHALDIENGYDPMEAAIISRRQRRRSTHELSPTQPFTRGHEPLRAEDPAVQPPLPRADAPFSLPEMQNSQGDAPLDPHPHGDSTTPLSSPAPHERDVLSEADDSDIPPAQPDALPNPALRLPLPAAYAEPTDHEMRQASSHTMLRR